MEEGTLVRHKTLGAGVVRPYLDFDGTTTRWSAMLKANGVVFIELFNPPPGYSKVVQVAIEALTQLPKKEKV